MATANTELKDIDQNCHESNNKESFSEVITLSIGECGCNIGSKLWNNYINEPTGWKQKWRKRGPTKIDGGYESLYNGNNYHKSFFYQNKNDKNIARNLSIDLDKNTINNIKISKNNYLFDPQFLIDSNEDASNNFIRGYTTMGLPIYNNKIQDKLRKLVENCDNLSGFMINHSISGGTGSGLTSLILEKLSIDDYKKKCKYTNSIMPVLDYHHSTSCVDPYNSILSLNKLIQQSSMTSIFDNEAIYKLCAKYRDIRVPSYDDMNHLIAQSISWSTWSLRSEIQKSTNLNSYQTTLVHFPRLHFLIHSMAPIWPQELHRGYYCAGGARPRYDIHDFAYSVTSSHHFLVRIADFDAEEDIYMSMLLMFRGDIASNVANEEWNWLKANKRVDFVEWIPNNIKIECKRITPHVNDKHLQLRKHDVFMIGNNTGIGRTFDERIVKKFDLMYSQKAYIHWYTKEGFEESQFEEVRENLRDLELDYFEILKQRFGDEDEDEYDTD